MPGVAVPARAGAASWAGATTPTTVIRCEGLEDMAKYRFQVLNEIDGQEEWVDSLLPVDSKVAELAAQIVELEGRLGWWERELEKFHHAAWLATGAQGDYPYPGVILIEIQGIAQELRLLKNIKP